MREDLALRHLLLTKARQLVKEKPKLNLTITELIQTLSVDYQRQEQRYLVKAEFQGQKLSVEVNKQDFQFYQKTELNKEPQITENSKKKDPFQDNNHKKALDVLFQLLIQTNQKDIENILNQSKNRNLTKPKFDRLAWALVFLTAICSAAFTWYQATRTFNFIDTTYTLEISWRILNGEVPYRDFTLVLVPGIYVKQAILMKIFGSKAIVGVWWSMFVMACTVILTHLILRIINTPRWLAVSLCLISASGGNLFRPYVWYDVDTIMLCLISIALVLWSAKEHFLTKHLFPIGLLIALPILFKQNIGLAHLVISSIIVYFHWLLVPYFFSWKRFLIFHLGIFTGLSILVLPLWWLGALPAFFDNTIVLAGKLRGYISVIGLILYFYPVWPAAKAVRDLLPPTEDLTPHYMCSFLIWGGMVASAISWFVGTHRNIPYLLMPLWVFGVSVATVYTSGTSVFALTPLVAILLAITYNFAAHFPKISKIFYCLVFLVAIVLPYILVPYALTERQLYFYKNAFTNPTPFKSSRLQGMSTSPEFAIGFDELVDFVSQLPSDETLALIPTEDPIYFATSRRSQLHIVQRYIQSGGSPTNYYLPELKRTKPNWVFQKITNQFIYWQPISDLEKEWLNDNYEQVKQLNNYYVWKRIDSEKPKN